MDITFAIVRAENADYLCHHANGIYVDVSNPMRTFVAGEDKFRLIEPDRSLELQVQRTELLSCTSFLCQRVAGSSVAERGG